MLLLHSVLPVSYTHLDVYKRQHIYLCVHLTYAPVFLNKMFLETIYEVQNSVRINLLVLSVVFAKKFCSKHICENCSVETVLSKAI